MRAGCRPGRASNDPGQMPDVPPRPGLDNAVRDPRERERIVLGYSRIRKHAAGPLSARRIRSLIGAIALAAGFVLVAAAPTTSALASTPTPLTITTTAPM